MVSCWRNILSWRQIAICKQHFPLTITIFCFNECCNVHWLTIVFFWGWAQNMIERAVLVGSWGGEHIYIYTYVYLSIILKSCYDDIAQSMLFCLCTTGLFFFQGRHQQLQTSSGFAAAGCLSCEDGWILPNQTWEISKVRQILLAPQWDMDISVQKRPKSQSHCLFFKWLDNTCFVQKYLGEEVRLFAWSREHNFQETRNS